VYAALVSHWLKASTATRMTLGFCRLFTPAVVRMNSPRSDQKRRKPPLLLVVTASDALAGRRLGCEFHNEARPAIYFWASRRPFSRQFVRAAGAILGKNSGAPPVGAKRLSRSHFGGNISRNFHASADFDNDGSCPAHGSSPLQVVRSHTCNVVPRRSNANTAATRVMP
jgi:hypothetical protein